MSYIYQANVWCNDCAAAISARLRREGLAPEDPDDECAFDSDEYPKRADDDDEADTPQHCAAGEHCINAIELPSGEKVGYLFGELTADGVDYVREAIEEVAAGLGSREVTDLWQQHFRDTGYDV